MPNLNILPIFSAKKVIIGPTCENSFEKMFDHVMASLPSNSCTRDSFENLNDFVKSSKRIIKFLPNYAQMADYARNIVEKISSSARFCDARISWNVIYEHDAQKTSLARMRFQMLESLVQNFRQKAALFDVFKFHEIKFSNVAEIVARISPNLARRNEKTIAILITSPKLALQVLESAILSDAKSTSWIFVDPTFQKEFRIWNFTKIRKKNFFGRTWRFFKTLKKPFPDSELFKSAEFLKINADFQTSDFSNPDFSPKVSYFSKNFAN